jgi:hypothetical protein
MKIVPVIDSVEIVRNKGHKPFLCPLCGKVDESLEYLRIFKVKLIQGTCVHSICLLNKLRSKILYNES